MPLLPVGQHVRMPVSYYYGGGERHLCSVILFPQQCANHELVPGADAVLVLESVPGKGTTLIIQLSTASPALLWLVYMFSQY